MSTELARQPLAPLDVTQTKQAMDTYQDGLRSLLDDTDWQRFGEGESERAFVKRSGWRKIATWFALNLETRSIEIDRDASDNPIRARVIARATAPNGRYCDGEGAASLTERRFSKPEHDLPATAATRALNRAISNLVGLGAVSAEEVDGGAVSAEEVDGAGGPDSQQAHRLTFATDQSYLQAITAARDVRPDLDAGELILTMVKAFGFQEGLPEVVARAMRIFQWWAEQAKAGNEKAMAPATVAASHRDAATVPRQPTPEEVYPPGRYAGD